MIDVIADAERQEHVRRSRVSQQLLQIAAYPIGKVWFPPASAEHRRAIPAIHRVEVGEPSGRGREYRSRGGVLAPAALDVTRLFVFAIVARGDRHDQGLLAAAGVTRHRAAARQRHVIEMRRHEERGPIERIGHAAYAAAVHARSPFFQRWDTRA